MTDPSDAGAGVALARAFDYAWERFVARLSGLGDDEYFWEPVSGSWSLRRGTDNRWRLDSAANSQKLDCEPVTTIAWRIGHVGVTLGGFADRLFSDGSRPDAGFDLPSTASDAIDFLGENFAAWRRGTATLPAAAWSRALGRGWGPYAESTVTDLALHVLDELVHHAAEIGLLRDLYAHRPISGSTRAR